MAEFSMDQFEQDYRNERREALRDSVKSGKTSLPVGILQHGVNRLGEGVSDTVQGIGAFAKSLYNNPQAVAESGAEGLESLYNRVAQGDPMAAMEVAGMVATGGATAAVAKGARLADFATFDPDTSRMFIGDVGAENLEKAGRPVAKKVLQVARQMRMRGASEAEIRAKTNQIIEKEDPSLGGVSSNAAGQLVVEIDDSKMALRSDSAIRRATGGYQNPEGGMYFPADVDNVLKGTVFPKAYPNEASIRIADISEADQQLGLYGEFEPSTNTLTTYVLNNEVPNVASHELQHYIQFKENFPKGANLDDAALGLYGPIADDYDEIASILINFANEKIPEDVFDAYDNPEIMKKSVAEMLEESGGDKLYAAEFAEAEAEGIRNNPRFYLEQLYRAVSGEVEARNVQTRLKMTAAERRATPPEDTEDIPRSQQTIIRRVQGGEVMQGIGTLNETARNMFRGPRGVGAYQQFAGGGEANRELEDFFNNRSQNEPPPARGLPPTKSPFGDGIRNFEDTFSKPQGRGKGYFDDVNFRIDSYEIDGKPSYAIEFDDGFSLFEPQIIEMLDENNSANEPIPGERTRKELFRYLFEKNPTSEEFFRYLKTTGLASGGEVSGPPPTRGPDPQGIGYFQQFADGGPVYMSNGGEGSVGAAYKDTINKYAEEFLVNPDVLFNLLKTESNFNPKAVNKASGAQGLAQVMPDTAADPGYDVTPLSDPFNAEDSIRFSAEYLSAMLEEFRGDYDLALAAYNAGPGRVRTYRGVPPFAETQNYIEKILGRVAPDEKQGRSGSGVNEQGEQVFTPRPLLRGETGYREELEGMPLKPRMRPSSLSQGIMAAQDTVDPAVIDRVVEQVQEELPPTQEESDLYEKYSFENMFPDEGLTEGETIRRELFAPKEGDAEPYRQPRSTEEQIDQFFQRFAPSRKPERVIQPKYTPMQYRSA